MNRALMPGLACVGFLLAGCSTPQPADTPLSANADYGKLAPPASVGRYQLRSGQVAIPPVLRQHAAPAYPPDLVHAGAKPVTVIVSIVVGRDGKVTDIHPAGNAQQPNARHARFVAAVKCVVSQWRFYPYRVQMHEPNGTVSQVPMPVTLWYAFKFTVTDGKPSVQTSRHDNG